jgi:hypothetical protein
MNLVQEISGRPMSRLEDVIIKPTVISTGMIPHILIKHLQESELEKMLSAVQISALLITRELKK